MLETKNLSLKLDNNPILSNINLTLEAGRIVSFLGANGSGKTSLLRCISGIEKGFSGTVEINKKDLKTLPQKDISQLVAFLPQELFIPPLVKVKDFLELSIVNKANKETTNELIEETSITYRLENLLGRDLQTLSGGERQRVKIAGVHIQQTPVILLDEPQSFLDPAGVSALWTMILGLKEQHNKLIVISTHDVAWSISKSDSLVCLKDGAVFRNLNLKETTDVEIKRTLEGIYEVDVMFS